MSGSATCSPIGSAGLSDAKGSWKTMPRRLPRKARNSPAGMSRRSRSSNAIRPEAMSASGPRRPSTASATVLLPEPDSPTNAKASPWPTEKDTSRKAVIGPAGVAYSTVRECTERNATGLSRLSEAQSGVEDLPQPVAQKIDTDHRDAHRDTGGEHNPRRCLKERSRIADHRARVGARRLSPDVEKAQRGTKKDGERHAQPSLNGERGPSVRQNLAEQDIGSAVAARAGRENKFFLSDFEGDAASEPHDQGYIDDTDRHHRLPKTRWRHRKDQEAEQDRRKRHEHVHGTHDEFVGAAAQIAGEKAYRHADAKTDCRGAEAHKEREPGAHYRAAEDITPEIIRAEPMGCAWRFEPREHAHLVIGIGSNQRRKRGEREDRARETKADQECGWQPGTLPFLPRRD